MENKITDKGWAAMRTLLDREMPEKRRKRFVWWWFALLLLPMALFGSWNWWNGSNKPEKTQQNTPVQVLAERTRSDADPGAGYVPAEATSPNIAAYQQLLPSKPTHRPTQKQALRIAQNPTSAHPSKPIAQIPVVAAPELPSLAAPSSDQPALPISSIATTVAPLDIVRSDQPAPAALPVAAQEKPKHWAFGANTVLSTEQFNSVNGFATGLTVDWKFAKKFGLRTGLLYSIYEPQEQHRPVASVASYEYTSKVDGNIIILDLQTGTELTSLSPNNSYGDSLSNNVFIPVNRLERMELPVALFWQASKHLKIFGGLTLKRTLSTKADRQNYSGDYILRLSDQAAEDGASRLSSSEFDHWSADATLGAGLQIGKIFELGIAAKRSLTGLDFSRKKTMASGFGAFDVVKTPSTSQNNLIFSLYGTMFF